MRLNLQGKNDQKVNVSVYKTDIMTKVTQRPKGKVRVSQTAAADTWCLSQMRASICKTGRRDKLQ